MLNLHVTLMLTEEEAIAILNEADRIKKELAVEIERTQLHSAVLGVAKSIRETVESERLRAICSTMC